MNSDLLEFHQFCKEEHFKLLDKYNLLYYGFGCKKNILRKMFPEALQFDMNVYTLNDILLELNIKYNTNYKHLSEFNCREIIILLDFNFKYACNFYYTSFRLIFTLEKINKEISSEDLQNLNIILRDLTTYEDYGIDTIEHKEVNIEGYLNVIRNGSKNSKISFKHLLEFNKPTVPVVDLFNKIKKNLMIIRKNLLFNFLSEFIEHKMIKIKDQQNIEILIDLKYFKDLIDECNKN